MMRAHARLRRSFTEEAVCAGSDVRRVSWSWGWLIVAGPQACSPEAPTAPDDSVLLAARGSGGGGKASTEIKISALDPDTVPADTVLSIRVLGSGFTAVSEVSWTLAGEATTEVTTSGPVTFVSSKSCTRP